MRFFKTHALFVLCLLFWGFSFLGKLHGEEAPISLTSFVDKSRITIGDLIQYTVMVRYKKDVTVKSPGTGANLGGFEIRDYAVSEPQEKKGWITQQYVYTISTFFTGEFEIAPLVIQYRLPGDMAFQSLSTSPIRIVVESVKPSMAGDIRDIKPPVDIPKNWWLFFLQIGIGLALCGAVIGGVFLYRRWKAGRGLLVVRETPPKPPHEMAIEALDRLKNSELLQKGEIQLFFIELSEIIRRYIGDRYFVVAMEMTTTEVLEKLSQMGLPEDIYRLFEPFFHTCDLVKFAKYRPSQDEIAEALDTAYALVHRTKIVIEMPEEAPQEEVLAPVEGSGGE